MGTDLEESRDDKNSKRVKSPSPARLTRAEAAALLHCSISSVRRLEGDVLHPIVGANGVHRFDPAELARVASCCVARPETGLVADWLAVDRWAETVSSQIGWQ